MKNEKWVQNCVVFALDFIVAATTTTTSVSIRCRTVMRCTRLAHSNGSTRNARTGFVCALNQNKYVNIAFRLW